MTSTFAAPSRRVYAQLAGKLMSKRRGSKCTHRCLSQGTVRMSPARRQRRFGFRATLEEWAGETSARETRCRLNPNAGNRGLRFQVAYARKTACYWMPIEQAQPVRSFPGAQHSSACSSICLISTAQVERRALNPTVFHQVAPDRHAVLANRETERNRVARDSHRLLNLLGGGTARITAFCAVAQGHGPRRYFPA